MKQIIKLYCDSILQNIEQLEYNRAFTVVCLLSECNAIRAFDSKINTAKIKDSPNSYYFKNSEPLIQNILIQYNCITVYYETDGNRIH